MQPSPGVTTPVIRQLDDVAVPMRDGTKLRADVFLPNGDGPFPTVVERTPYDKRLPGLREVYRRLAEAGYAVVAQDLRGRFASEGTFHPNIVPGWTDAEDGYETIEWAAAQPWSSGRVGIFGHSYSSWAAWVLAPLKPPHLVAMFTGGMAPKHTDWMLGGVFRPARQLQWTLGQLAPNTQRFLPEPAGPTTAGGYGELEAKANRDKWTWFLPYGDLPPEALGGMAPPFRRWLAEMHHDPWRIDETFGSIDLPVFHRTGWYDRLNRTVDMFKGMHEGAETTDARRNQHLLVGPWTHTSRLRSTVGDIDFGPDANLDYAELLIAWFDRWLPADAQWAERPPTVRYFVMGANRWRTDEAWPPRRAALRTLYLHSEGRANTSRGDGVLSREAPADEPSDRFRYDPRDPVMSLQSDRGHDEPRDHRLISYRRDLLVYQSEPLQEPLEVTGHPEASIWFASDAPDTDVIVRLIDVWSNGFAQNLCYGILRARFRHGFDRPTPLAADAPFEAVIRMQPTSNLFRAGHRIRLDVTSSDFPNFDRNHNTGGEDWRDPELRVARQVVFHDHERPSRLVLPVVAS